MKTSLQYIILTILCGMQVAASDTDSNQQPMIAPENVSIREISEKTPADEAQPEIDIKVGHVRQKSPAKFL